MLVLAGVLLVGYHLFTPVAHAQPQPEAGSCTPGTDCGPAEWVAPVDAPTWGGFRTLDNPDHQGVDLGATRGTPIRAASAGVVVRAKCDVDPTYGCDRDGSPQIRGCGWYVDIRHPGDVYTRYCHMQHRPDVTVDQQVSAGQVLGLVGSSGRSSAPHLHFEVHLGDETSATATDPVPFMAAHGAPLGTNT